MIIRRLLVLAVALLVAVQVVRNAAVAALADRSPAAAFKVWPTHPAAEIAVGMTEIGTAAHEQKPVGRATFEMIDDAAAKAPLEPEPFLVRGVQAELDGKRDIAARAFMAAESRDPRSLPARYFLADIFYRLGDPRRTLNEIGALSRLAPNGTQTLAPYLAAYAKDRAAWPYLRELFRSNANLADASLTALAREPAYADAVLALADRSSAAKGSWAPTLVNSLVNAHQYGKARAVWAAASNLRLPPDLAIYDAAFSDSKAPPPFNWNLISSTVGLSEREPGGRLHVIFYGQEDGLLAGQMLVLPQGSYRLTMKVSGDPQRLRAMIWSVRCDGSTSPFASVALDTAARGWVFTVPSGCGAQWLELAGVSGEISQQTEARISGLTLVPEHARG
jgi:hypothetical protein